MSGLKAGTGPIGALTGLVRTVLILSKKFLSERKPVN